MKRILVLLFVLLCPVMAHATYMGGTGGSSLPTTCSDGQVVAWNVSTNTWSTCASLAGGGDMLTASWTSGGYLAKTKGGLGMDVTSLTGPIKFTSGVPSVLAYSDIVAKWASGSCSGYLKSDGTCDSGGGGSMTWPSGTAGIPNYNGSSAWGTSYSASNQIPANFLKSGTLTDGKGCLYTTANGFVCNSDFQASNTYLGQIAGLTPTANNVLGWNSGGTAIENKSTLTGLTFGGFTASKAIVSDGSGNLAASTFSGIVKESSGTKSASAASDIVGLFNSGTCSGYLKSDGTCSTPGGGGDVTGGSTSADGELAAYSGTGGKTLKQSFVAFSGPATSVKTKTISNANDTIAELGANNTFTGTNAFNGITTIGDGGDLTQYYVQSNDTAFASDHTGSGLIMPVTCGATLAIGDAVYMASTGKVGLAKADAAGTTPAIGIMLESCSDTDHPKKMLIRGVIRDDTWNWTVGGLVYISVTGTTGNTLTQTAPTSANNIVNPIGIAIHADYMLVNPTYVLVEVK